jgi:hypothetical protein
MESRCEKIAGAIHDVHDIFFILLFVIVVQGFKEYK